MLFVGCLPVEVVEEDIYPIFAAFGEIARLEICRDVWGVSLSFGFLQFESETSEDAAISELHGLFYCGNRTVPMHVRKFFTGHVFEYAASDAGASPLRSEAKNSENAEPSKEDLAVTTEKNAANLVYISRGFEELADEDLQYHLAMQYGPIVSVGPCEIRREFLPVGLVRIPSDPSAEEILETRGVVFLYEWSATQLAEDALMRSVFLPNGDVAETLSIWYFQPEQTYLYRYESAPTLASPALAANGARATLQGRERIFRPLSEGYYASEEYLDSSMWTKLFVGCLPYCKNALEISAVFGQFGQLIEVAVLTDVEGKSRGAAFVTFARPEEAQLAISKLTGFVFPGSSRSINVSLAHKQDLPFHVQAVPYFEAPSVAQ